MTIVSAVQEANAADLARDHRDPVRRISQFLDPCSLHVVRQRAGLGVVVARGRIEGSKVIVFCTDATISGGAIGGPECSLIAAAIEAACSERCPVIGIWHSGGAKLAEGVVAMDGIGRMFAAMVRASGQVLQLSLILGPAAGGAAYGAALTDLVIMSDGGRVFITGPDIVRSVTGERIDMSGLGGPEVHGRRSGVAHLVADSEEAAFRQARNVVTLFAQPGHVDVSLVRTGIDLRTFLPESPRRAYDVRPLVRAIVDGSEGSSSFLELQEKWAPNIVVALGRIGGRTVGVIANNPLRKGGCLDSLGRESGAICSHVRRIRHTASRAGRRTGLSSGHQPGVGRGGPSRRKAPARVRRGSRPPGNPGDPEIVRRRLHCDELALPRRHRGARLA